MRFCITGWYGYGNLGDELMLRSFMIRLQKLDPNAEVELLIFGDPARLWLPEGIPTRVVCARDTVATVRAIARSDALLWVGGTCLHRHGFATYYQGAIARAFGTRLYWIGIGADQVGDGLPRLKAQFSLAWVNAATFRDAASERLAAALWPPLSSEVTEDLVYLTSEEPWFKRVRDERPRQRKLVVSWFEFQPFFDSQPSSADAFAELVPEMCKRLDLQVVQVLNMAGPVDEAANVYLERAIRNVVSVRGTPVELEFHSPANVADQLALLQRADFVFSVRMHGVLVSKLLGVPALGIAYAAKARHMADNFDQPIVFSFADLRRNPERVLAQMEHEQRAPASLRKGLPHHQALADRNLHFLNEQWKN